MKTHPIKWTSCVHGEIAHLSLQKVHWLSSLFVCPAMVTQSATLSYFPLYKSYHFSKDITLATSFHHPDSGFQCFQSQCSKSSSVENLFSFSKHFLLLLLCFSSPPQKNIFSLTKYFLPSFSVSSAKKYTFLLQIFSFFSFPVFLLICKKYVFLLQIFKCQTFLCQPEMSTVIR